MNSSNKPNVHIDNFGDKLHLSPFVQTIHSLTSSLMINLWTITKTRLFKYTEYHRKTENFQTKKSNIFHISAQNMDCGTH